MTELIPQVVHGLEKDTKICIQLHKWFLKSV